MEKQIETTVRESLRALGELIRTIVQQGVVKGIYKPREYGFIKHTIQNFRYNENGVEISSSLYKPIFKPIWSKALLDVREEVRKSSEYTDAIIILGQVTDDKLLKIQLLLNFIDRLSEKCFVNSENGSSYLETLIKQALLQLNNEKSLYQIDIHLYGIIILTRVAQIATNAATYKIRKPAKKDFEYVDSRMVDQPIFFPSCIVNIQLLAHSRDEISNHIFQAITVLSLFGVGSVQSSVINTSTESLTETSSSSNSLTPIYAQENYILRNPEDARKLIAFWQYMAIHLPNQGYGHTTNIIESVDIAFRRYTDALINDSLLEKRVASTMMGIECLFSKENTELSYRLKIRTSKVLGLIGYDPYDVKKSINFAYTVRSAFVHGDNISRDEMRKINAEYGNLRTLLKIVLDYLRLSIVFYVTIKDQYNKEKFIELVDDALIDPKKQHELQQLIENGKSVIGYARPQFGRPADG